MKQASLSKHYAGMFGDHAEKAVQLREAAEKQEEEIKRKQMARDKKEQERLKSLEVAARAKAAQKEKTERRRSSKTSIEF